VAALVALAALETWPRLATSIFAPVIALFLICFVPTEFFGSLTVA
jgi:hypothetical protein